MRACCKPHLYACFKREQLVALYERHSGARCYGRVDMLDLATWYKDGTRLVLS